MENSKKIQLGYCSSPHGIKGELTFSLFNPESRNIQKNTRILLIPKSAQSSLPELGQEFIVLNATYGNKLIVNLENVNDRNTVEKMIPFNIYIDRADLVEIEEDEYYLSDLIGVRVIDVQSNELGTVQDFYENSAQVILVIKNENEIIEVLFIDQFIKEVDLEKGQIIIVRPEMVE